MDLFITLCFCQYLFIMFILWCHIYSVLAIWTFWSWEIYAESQFTVEDTAWNDSKAEPAPLPRKRRWRLQKKDFGVTKTLEVKTGQLFCLQSLNDFITPVHKWTGFHHLHGWRNLNITRVHLAWPKNDVFLK